MSEEKPETSCGPDEDSEASVPDPVAGPGPGPGVGGEALDLCDRHNCAVPSRCSPEEPSTISPVLAEETFRYMILSTDRVEHMAKTYSDMDMVTQLLTERDRDLELAARIGQSLLQRNHLLKERNNTVEEQLTQALDQVQQLQHMLNKKEELLRMVSRVSEESETDSTCSTPLPPSQPPPTAITLSQLGALQSKLQDLEEENRALRSEACHLETQTISYEEKEQQLVNDCVRELRESNSQIVALTDELSKKNDDLLHHQEGMTQLLNQVVELQTRVKELALEKEELRIHLQHSKDAQRQLTAELKELHSRNVECVGMLQESQEEVKQLRSRSMPCAAMRRPHSYGLFPMDSLAAEIEGSMRRELSMEEEQEQKSSQKRVFQTVRTVNEMVRNHAPRPIPGSAQSGVVMTAQPFWSCVPPAQLRSEETPTNNRQGTGQRQPGSLGGSDLESALHRLSLRQQNFLCERQFFQAEQDRKLQALAGVGPEGARSEAEGEVSGCCSPNGSALSCMTDLSDLSAASSTFKSFLPEKLQIVKPMEGSLTLHHWQQLAQPHLATILDPHPGVVTKGFRPLPQDTMHHLTDLEEDDDEEEEEGGITFQVQCASTPQEKKQGKSTGTPGSVCSTADAPQLAPPPLQTPPMAPPPVTQLPESHVLATPAHSPAHNPGKCLSSTFSTYTFTTCRILHPCDITQVTPSSVCSSGSELTPSSLRSGPSTPVTSYRLSLGDSFPPRHVPAAPRGLTQLLLERGISAQPQGVPKKTVAPSPPTTPPNSPSHSPPPSPLPPESRRHLSSSSSSTSSTSVSDNFLASRPVEVFLQEVYGLKLGRPRPELPSPTPGPPSPASVSLVERLRRLGLAGALPKGAGSEVVRRHQESATFLAAAAGGRSLMDGLRRNQSLPAMVGGWSQPICGPSPHPVTAPPPHSSSPLVLPITPWGSLKEPIAGVSSPVQAPPPPRKA
ncbi:hypothetical protein JZ751_004475 [Albula glossodonta]|uniref:Trafficking protein, kinesin binding 2 n=1 Tax=Albula glossodonta TaxID=121402 RepID=A0A8T2NA09_9TELE|nr:hypothetical protein JZ751_004475 [Albula glossodonta]